jgi:hypothetical protein
MARPYQSSTVTSLVVRTTLVPVMILTGYLVWSLTKSAIALLDRYELIALLATYQTAVFLSILGPPHLQLLLLLYGMLGLAISLTKHILSSLPPVRGCQLLETTTVTLVIHASEANLSARLYQYHDPNTSTPRSVLTSFKASKMEPVGSIGRRLLLIERVFFARQ